MPSIPADSAKDKANRELAPVVDVRTPPALVDFGRAIGRDMPASLKRTKAIAAKIRAVSGTPPAKKGR